MIQNKKQMMLNNYQLAESDSIILKFIFGETVFSLEMISMMKDARGG